jgi:Domain of unknown function DUF29
MISYDKDFYSWTQEQAELLRKGQFNSLDIPNLIEEIETMGRSEKRELESRLTVLLLHLLKWKYQPARRGRSWNLTIKGQRIEYSNVLTDNPGLKPQLNTILGNAYKLARVKAATETQLDIDTFPTECPWMIEDITNDNFYPD